MFTYAPVDCKSISSYEATNGVYHGLLLRRPGCRCVVPRCRGGVDDVYVCVCVCVGGCSCWGGGGKSRRILASISMGGPNLKSECDMYEIIMGGEFDPGPVPYFRGD